MKKNKNTIIAIIATLAFIAIGALTVFFSRRPEVIPPNNPDHIGNTPGNLANGGYFAEAEGLVYFANTFDNGAIYVMNSDETEMRKLNDYNASYINVGGGYLYFVQGSSEFSGTGFGAFRVLPGLYRSTTQGTNTIGLKVNAVLAATLGGNEIFYQNFNSTEFTRLYRIATSGEPDVQLSSSVINPASYVNGIIYYSDPLDYRIYALDTGSGYASEVLNANTYNTIYDSGYLYFMDQGNSYRLCRYSLYDQRIEVLTNDRVDAYNVLGGVIFYQKSSRTEPGLYRMNSDGSDPVLIRPGNHSRLSLTSRHAYFSEFGVENITYKAPLYGPAYAELFAAASLAVE